jgi:sugar lactone lactonase YvrE
MNETTQISAVKTSAIIIPGDRYFPEGVTVTSDGTFFVGSMFEGCIMRALSGSDPRSVEPFIEAGANGLVSVLGLWADDAHQTLWACSSDAGNGRLTGRAPVGLKAFDLQTGVAKGSYDFPGGGFPNDLTFDADGNLYVTDSWTPRILRLRAGSTELDEWINDPQLGVEQWSLNGIDFDRSSNVIYTVNQRAGLLFRIAIEPAKRGSAGAVTLIQTSQELRRPDGLKVIGPNTLATAEGGAGGMSIINVEGDRASVRRVPVGLDGVTTFAFYQGSAWVVEGQSDHFWDPVNAGPNADPPFRIVEIPLD